MSPCPISSIRNCLILRQRRKSRGVLVQSTHFLFNFVYKTYLYVCKFLFSWPSIIYAYTCILITGSLQVSSCFPGTTRLLIRVNEKGLELCRKSSNQDYQNVKELEAQGQIFYQGMFVENKIFTYSGITIFRSAIFRNLR